MRQRTLLWLRPATDLAIPAIYAWFVSLALPAWSKLAPPAAPFLALLVLAIMAVGAVLVSRRFRVVDYVGVAILASSAVTWWYMGTSVAWDAWRVSLGAMGWSAFCLTWVRIRSRSQVLPLESESLSRRSRAADTAGSAPTIQPRDRLAAHLTIVRMMGIVGTCGLVVLSYTVLAGDRGVVLQLAAVLACLGVLNTIAAMPSRAVQSAKSQLGPAVAAVVLCAVATLGLWLGFAN